MPSRPFNFIIIFALLLSLLGGAVTVTPARAATFNVASAAELITAINTANSNGQNDTITLTANITLTTVNNDVNGLPIIGADGGNSLIINGNGFTIARSSVGGTPNFRIMEVGSGANLTLQNITISNGFTFTFGGAGGGVFNNSGSLTVINSVFNGNSSNCDPGCTTGGGAIASSGSLSVSNSTFSNNSTDGSGGAVSTSQFATITNSTFFQNSADRRGGAIHNSGSLLITNSTLSNNSAPNGGGIFNMDSLTVANSTITDNSAILNGGGLYNWDGLTTSINNTFSDNGAVDGGNIYVNSLPTSEVQLKNTIVSTTILFQNNCASFGTITAGADTLATDLTCDSATPVTIGMLNLSTALANNGGPTQTLALLSGSAAIDTGNDATCNASVGSPNYGAGGFDQRGVTRPQGASCDVGAYELTPPPAVTSAVYDASAGTLTVTGTNLLANGSGSDIIANKFTITGEGGSTYTLTDTANVELATATTFVFNLSASDNFAVRMILNKNGTTSTGGTTYNLAAADDWDAGANPSDNITDPVNALTVVNVSVPNIQSATYNAASGLLTVFGSRMLSFSGANNDINISKLTIAGEGGNTYTLTSGNVELTSSTSFSVTLNSADRDALRQILNKDGTSANDGTLYNLAAADDWNNGADPALSIQDTTGNGITVSNVVPPTLLVTKTDSVDPAAAGESMSYTVTIQNSGTPNYDAHNVRLTDQLPGGFVVTQTQPSQGSCSPVVGSTLSCTLGTIASGASANVVITGNHPSNTVSGTITNNIAYVTSAEGNNGNDGNDTPADNDDARAEEPTTILRQPDVSISKTVDKPSAQEGDTVTFSLAISNNGLSQASNVVVTDAIPTGLTFVGFSPNTQPCVYAAPTLTCTFPTLNSGQTENISIIVSIDSGSSSLTPITNKASVTTSDPETNLGNNIADASIIIGAPTVLTQSLTVNYTGTGPNSFTVTFSEEVYNPAGDTDTDDVTNPANFLLIEKGVNGVVDTKDCSGGVQTDDLTITVSGVTYINPTALVTLPAPLPVGNYRLFVCATTSIVDLTLTPLNGGSPDYTFDFTVTAATNSGSNTEDEEKITASALPKTGFAPKTVTTLPAQPANLEYAKLGDLVLEIPSLNVKSTIVGVPESNGEWDVTWLGNSVGWLNGTAFPTWNGNSVLTAHVTNASGVDGPFAALKTLKYGDQIIVHLGGAQYVYEVRNSRLARPYSTSYAFESKSDAAYLTLITCQGYNPLNDTYLFRRVVRAVLIEVK